MGTESFSSTLLAVFGIGGWEVVLIVLMLAVMLILYGARNLPELGEKLRRRFEESRDVTDDAEAEIRRETGLIYEALTPDNRTADFTFRGPRLENQFSMILFIAQGFGIGRIPFAPGTFGSLVGMLWFVLLLLTANIWVYMSGAVLGVGLSIWLCGAAERILRQKDPPSVVLDEIVALPFCFLPWVAGAWLRKHAVPPPETFFTTHTWLATVAIFTLFRVFDIAKPWPVGQSQRLPGGWGVTVDDLLAAAYVALLSLAFLG
jgi:phosphatidylglycerophosphatase A